MESEDARRREQYAARITRVAVDGSVSSIATAVAKVAATAAVEPAVAATVATAVESG